MDDERFKSFTTHWPVRLTAGCETLILAMRVQFPHGSLNTAKWWNWDTRDAQNVVPFVAWEFESPLGYWIENETVAGEPALSRAS